MRTQLLDPACHRNRRTRVNKIGKTASIGRTHFETESITSRSLTQRVWHSGTKTKTRSSDCVLHRFMAVYLASSAAPSSRPVFKSENESENITFIVSSHENVALIFSNLTSFTLRRRDVMAAAAKAPNCGDGDAFVKRELFGGAITMDIPRRLVDVSQFRQVLTASPGAVPFWDHFEFVRPRCRRMSQLNSAQ